MTTQEKLQRIHGYVTRYELAAVKGEHRILIGYIVRTSRQGMLDACRKYGSQLVDVLQVHPEQLLVFNRTIQAFELGDWSIRLTGRTQRTAIIEGELPFIVDEWNKIGAEVTK